MNKKPINNGTSHLKSPKNQNLGTASNKITEGICGRPTLVLSSALVPQTLSCLVCVEDSQPKTTRNGCHSPTARVTLKFGLGWYSHSVWSTTYRHAIKIKTHSAVIEIHVLSFFCLALFLVMADGSHLGMWHLAFQDGCHLPLLKIVFWSDFITVAHELIFFIFMQMGYACLQKIKMASYKKHSCTKLDQFQPRALEILSFLCFCYF